MSNVCCRRNERIICCACSSNIAWILYQQAYPGDQGVAAWQRAKPSADAWLASQPEMLEIRVYAPAWPYLESLLFACPSLFFEYEAKDPDMPQAVRQYSVPTREIDLIAWNLIDWLEHSDGHTETRFYDRLRPSTGAARGRELT